MSEIGHASTTEPGIGYANGVARLSDLNIAAALLSLDGAAWDGTNEPVYEPAADADERRVEWQRKLDLPGVRQIHVVMHDHALGTVNGTVIKAGGWTDKATGKHYQPGESAPFRRVFYGLRGEYRYYTHGAVTRRVAWDGDDFAYWFAQWFKRGGLLSAARVRAERRDELLDINRRCYGIASRLPAGGGE